MARKRRPLPGAEPAAAAPAAPTPADAVPATAVPPEVVRGDATAPLLATMMFLTPALGVPTEAMLQDTLKSVLVSFFALAATLLFCLAQRKRQEPLRWHAVLWLPLALMAWALGSMAWSHPYLGAVEAIRWFVFSLLLWLGLNTLSRERLPLLAWGIHGGAVVASLWAALQFWVDSNLFPQGPPPASTFVNRNFFAEFAASTLPFGVLLLARARSGAAVAGLAASVGLVVVAVLMTGTRAALLALWVLVLLVLPLVLWRCRAQLAIGSWSGATRAVAGGVLLGTVVLLGAIPSGNAKIIEEARGSNALERGFKRTQSIRPGDSSLAVRKVMWRATLRVIEARPLSGVGAGAWESDIPLYQEEGSQLETDYYVHNEFLQLVAEYGLVGWGFLLGLAAWLLRLAWRSWRPDDAAAAAEQPWRATALASLLAFFIVSNVGFPWRMAATGALFAVCLALLAASEARTAGGARWGTRTMRWSPGIAQAGVFASLACLALAAFITQRAGASESRLVKATRFALTVNHSGNAADPQWVPVKEEIVRLAREGIALNPHYRKITPMIADEMARWGDWRNAVWIWESVLASRPHIVAIMCNVARGYASTGEPQKAWAYLQRARQLQPRAPAVRSLEVILLARAGQSQQALQLAREAITDNVYDYDLVNATFILAWRAGDRQTALHAMQLRMQNWPESRASGYVHLGTYYATEERDTAKALDAWRRGLALATPTQRETFRGQIPQEFHSQLGLAP